ncbi:hypothetical protein DPMN_033251 [Dreissena polymorpha]|uniref:CCHC-type domain-containing protein n=1 Tax=Dreissena polymorpha TaxID=45954 RepID=A0A9D4M839_DREPO|nr:hypothetical protein DPMN_033251 [Dreissena polymorpha]
MCYACGRYGHMKTDRNCPEKGRKCRKCKKEGHFEKCCKSKLKFEKPKHKFAKVRTVECEESPSDSEDSYVFTVTRRKKAPGDIHVNIGGIETPVIVWEDLKKQKMKCKSFNNKESLCIW